MTRQDLSRRRFLGELAAGTVAGTSLLAAARHAAAKKRGGTITVGMPNDWNTFDPHNLAFANFTLQQNLYDTLTRYDQNLKPLPGLAEKWTVAPDGQSVTLMLRKGVKFHSGKELVAADVVKNFEKAADKDRGFNMLPAVANVAEVTAPDAGTVGIKFKKVSPEVFDLLQAMAIIEPAAMESLKNRGSAPARSSSWSGFRETIRPSSATRPTGASQRPGRTASSSRCSATRTPWSRRSSRGSAT
jgi:ABC-type transport system substrate-binding protein